MLLSRMLPLALACCGASHAQTGSELKAAKQPRPDPLLAAALDAAGVHYSSLANGDLQVRVRLESGRGQRVVLRSATRAHRSEEWRELYSVAHILEPAESLQPSLAERLLRENDTLALGAWSLAGDQLSLTLHVPARSSPLRLVEAIDFAADVADTLERELGGEDDSL